MIILAIQLVLSFLGPTFTWGARHVFLSDVWCFLCIGPALLWASYTPQLTRKNKRQLLVWLAGCAALLGFIYLHGYFRPAVEPLLREIYFRINPDNDTFNAKREIIFYLRFLSWLSAAGIVATIKFSRKNLVTPLKTLVICMASAFGLMVLAKISPQFNHALDGFYSRDSSYDIWKFRSYGPFSSPVEGGAVLGLTLLLTLGSRMLSRTWLAVALISGLGGLLLTHAMSSVVALAIAGAYTGFYAKKGDSGKRLFFASLGLLLLFVVALGVLFPGALLQKRIDLFARLDPWLVLLRVIFSRWDLALFGLGLPNYSVDNSYLFILIRGGVLCVGVVAWLTWRFGRTLWRQVPTYQQAAVIYLAVSGFMFDVIVFRNIVYLLLTIGIPLVVYSRKSSGSSTELIRKK